MNTILAHPLTKKWESINQRRYGKAYDEMLSLFGERLSSTFEESEIMMPKKGIEYLTKILIEHMHIPFDPKRIKILLGLRYNPVPHIGKTRSWEYAGEVILINIGVFGKDKFYEEGKKSFEGATSLLEDLEKISPIHSGLNEELDFQSTRLKLNRSLSKNYTSLVEIFENIGLIRDPWYKRFQDMTNQLGQ